MTVPDPTRLTVFNIMLTERIKIPPYRRLRPTTEMRPMLDIWRPQTWRSRVAKVLSVQLSEPVLKRVKETPAERMFADTMSYLDEALEEYRTDSFEAERQRLVQRVLAEFRTIRAFHGCKPVSVVSYLERGLLPLTREWLAQETFDLFEGTIPHAEIDALVSAADLETRLGRIYFCTDPKDLIATAGRYLSYGPESVCCVFGDSRRFHEARERQRRRGIPTMLECAVPLTLMSESWQAEVACEIITEYFRSESVEPDTDPNSRDFCIGIHGPLPATYIIGHFHPPLIDDPHCPWGSYRNSSTKCPMC